MSTENGRNGFIEEVQKDLRDRAWVSYAFSFVYFVLTFILLTLAILVYYFAPGLGIEDAETLVGPREALDTSFHDATTNPHDGTVIAVGDDSSILVLSEDGEIKHDYKGPGETKSDLRSIALSGDGKTAIVAGDDGAILVSTDRGKSWKVAESITGKDFIRVALNKKGNIAIAVGDRGLIWISDDYGRTWSRPDPSNVTSKHINDIVLSDNGKFAIAAADDEVILLSNDGGKTWNATSYGEGKLDFQAVALHGNTAVVVGDNGFVLISCDIEEGSWHPLATDKKSDFNDIAISGDGETAIAVGRKGVVWTLDLAGADQCSDKKWVKRESNIADTLESVALNHNGSIAIAVGRDGTILVSANKGDTWGSRNSGTASDFNGVTLGLDGMSAAVVGKNSTALWLESSGESLVLDQITVVQKEDNKFEVAEFSKFEKIATFESYFLRVAVTLVLWLMAQYLMSLTRYNLRLAAFYNGRRDAIRLAPTEAFPQPKNVAELEQMMYALSPDSLDFGRSPKVVVDRAMQLARTFRQDGKNSNTDK